MYEAFYGLNSKPFQLNPDPNFFFGSKQHRRAKAYLEYGVSRNEGFIIITGEIGAGKTTVCRCFLEQIPKHCHVAYIFNPKLTVHELLQSICEEFGVAHAHQGPGAETVKDYLDPLNTFLLRNHAAGQNNVLVIDEAQMLSADVLEQLRLLTNLETNERKLLQIVLIGQPELREMLARPELEQLAQRVIARFHLDALSQAETEQYIRHRLSVAGLAGALPFDRDALRRIHHLSRGVPRRINLLCDRAMLGAYATGQTAIGRAIIDKAAGEVFDSGPGPARSTRPARTAPGRLVWGALGLAAGAGLFGVMRLYLEGAAPRPGTSAVAASTARPLSPSASAPGAATAPASRAAASAASAAPAAASAASAAIPVALAGGDLGIRFKTALRSDRDAWRELAQAWNLTLGETTDPCAEAQRERVWCFRSPSSTLALIRQLDRPGIVTLVDDRDRPVHALLTGLTDRGATLRVGGESQTVTLASLANLWRGDFSTLWRAPPGYAGKIVDGARGVVAEGLASQLARLQGTPAPADGKPPTDAALKGGIAAFQLAQGLKPDGLAGPTTFMQLNRATGVAEPRLRSD